MNFPKVNVPLIEEVLEHIKMFPHTYDQNDVARSAPVTGNNECGAIGCFGGWAVLLSMPLSQRHERANNVSLSKAKELLGLTEGEAYFLFAGASGNPEKDYELIQKRLTHIRESRCFAEGKIDKSVVTHDKRFGGPIDYSEEIGL